MPGMVQLLLRVLKCAFSRRERYASYKDPSSYQRDIEARSHPAGATRICAMRAFRAQRRLWRRLPARASSDGGISLTRRYVVTDAERL